MEKLVSLRNILQLHAEMRSLILESGVDEERYDRLINKLEQKSVDYVTRLAVWIEALRCTEYFEVLKIKRLLPDEIWQRYKEFGEEKLREQRLLIKAQRHLRRAFNGTRPKTKPEVTEGDTGGVTVRSEDSGTDVDSGGVE